MSGPTRALRVFMIITISSADSTRPCHRNKERASRRFAQAASLCVTTDRPIRAATRRFGTVAYTIA